MVKKEVSDKSVLFLSFLLPTVIMLTIFVLRGIYPFGDRSFLSSDMYHQYMPFFSEFLRTVREGDGLFYSYQVGIGSNFLALYAYYLACPLNWLAFLFPEAYLCEFMSCLVVCKLGFAGWTFAYYLLNKFQRQDFSVLLFACFYALSGFTAAYNHNIMWLDCVALLPLVVLGLERLVKEDKWVLYSLSLGLCILSNFYISIMVCIFLVLYFAVLLITERRNLRVLGNFVLYSLLAGGMAAVLLIPSVCAMSTTDFGAMDFPATVESYFSVLDMLSRHCVGVEAERGLAHWPNIYCGAAVFLLVPLYALNEKIPARKRFVNLSLAGFLLMSFEINILDFVWHGFNFPNSFPARQSFLYIFLILTMSYEACGRAEEVSREWIIRIYLGAVVFLLWVEKFVESQDFGVWTEILTLLFVTVYAVLLYLRCTQDNPSGRKRLALCLAALVAVVAETSYNTAQTSVSTVSRSAYLEHQEDYRALYASLQAQDGDFYRVEKFTRKTKNDGTLMGYPTASVFSSTLNSSVMDLYKRLGMRHSKVYYGYDGATAFTAALFNVKYMFGASDEYAGSLYRPLEESGGIVLYESAQTLPFGYVAPLGYDLPEGEDSQFANTVWVQNQLVEDLGVSGELLTEVSSSVDGEDVDFTVQEAGNYYARLTAGGTSEIEVFSSIDGTQSFRDLKDEAIIYLGELAAGEAITLTNGDEEDTTQAVSADIYRLEETVLAQALEVLGREHLTNVRFDSTHLSGRLELAASGRLILSIPYEAGWKVLLNGEEVEPELFGGALMAFDLEAGSYELEMQYAPAGIGAGLAVSLVSGAAFLLLLYRERNRKATKAPGVFGRRPLRTGTR